MIVFFPVLPGSTSDSDTLEERVILLHRWHRIRHHVDGKGAFQGSSFCFALFLCC